LAAEKSTQLEVSWAAERSKQQVVVRSIERVEMERFVSNPALPWEINAGDLP
jgi:hypothetical protein